MNEFDDLPPDDSMSDEDAWEVFELVREGGFILARFDYISLSRLLNRNISEDVEWRPGLTDKEIALAARLQRDFLA